MQEDGKGGGTWTEGIDFSGQHDGFVNAVEWIKGDGDGEPIPPFLSPVTTPATALDGESDFLEVPREPGRSIDAAR